MTGENEKARMDVLTLQDLIILRQMIEKGFRIDFFNTIEIPNVKMIHEKLSIIIQQVYNQNKH
jgi:hypothetical protein